MPHRRTMSIPLNAVLTISFLCTASAFTGTFRAPVVVPSKATGSDRKYGSSLGATKEENPSVGGSVILQGDAMSLLQSAFSALSDDDKYDAVMTGLCAKILDGEASSSENDVVEEASYQSPGYAKLADPIRLLQEMNNRRLKASGRSIMALVDATVTVQDAAVMSTVLSLATRNGRISEYGASQSDIQMFPPTDASKFRNIRMGGRMDTRASRLESLEDIPTDDRAAETTSALAAMFTVGFCLIINTFGSAFGMANITPLTGFLLGFIITLGIVDNGFDAIQFVASNLIKSNDKVPDSVKNFSVDKENLPMKLGSGKITGTVALGLTRLFAVDTERECECEAAALFAAYALGLPCFAFRPNALEAAVLMFESNSSNNQSNEWNTLDSLWSNIGIMKMLVWLIAPVALESSKHPQLIVSDPREASGFLKRLREKASAMGISNEELESMLPPDEDEDLLKWAYAEADLLLRDNKNTVQELTELLVGGAGTVGDCVAILEDF